MHEIISTTELEHLARWEGRTEALDDVIVAAPLRGLSAVLDRDDPLPRTGDEVPPLAHWLYFLPAHRQTELGHDGHAKRGGFLPPVSLPRRMWAGGRLQWKAPLRVGEEVRRVSTITSVSRKRGRTGDLLFVVVRHEISNPGGIALVEEHDIVYRGAPQAGDSVPTPEVAAAGAAWSRTILPDAPLLFRYSALTFNGHRIHYDRRYVTEVEGYPGLIVHGPLIATLLVDLARRENPASRLTSFTFKAIRPTFDLQAFRVKGNPSADGHSAELWACDHEGWLTMKAEASFA